MDRARVNGIELEYEIRGAGEPVLLVHGAHLADGMAPLLDTPALEGFQLVNYHRRGYAGSSRPVDPCTIAVHADDAAALLDHLGIGAAHVVGHSSGAVIALELGARHPSRVRSLSLLEPAVLGGPSGAAFAAAVAPLVNSYQAGDAAGAVTGFLALVGTDDWRATIERSVPGGIDQAVKDAATFFDVELGAATVWEFDRGRAMAVACPVLSVLGSESGPFFAEGRQFLHEWFNGCVDADLEGLSHLLQMEATEVVAESVAQFLRATETSKAV